MRRRARALPSGSWASLGTPTTNLATCDIEIQSYQVDVLLPVQVLQWNSGEQRWNSGGTVKYLLVWRMRSRKSEQPPRSRVWYCIVEQWNSKIPTINPKYYSFNITYMINQIDFHR